MTTEGASRPSAEQPTAENPKPYAPLGPTRQCECSLCGRRFGGITGFDAHRKGGACTDPAALGYRQDERGFWSLPMSQATKDKLFGGAA